MQPSRLFDAFVGTAEVGARAKHGPKDIKVRALDPEAYRRQVGLRWLMKLRWGAILGQTLAIAAAHYLFHVSLFLVPLLAICMLGFVTNLWLTWHFRSAQAVSAPTLGRLVAQDVVCLTLLLSFSGGYHNPFYFLYLVPLSLAAMMLDSAPLCRVTLLCTLGVTTLFFWHAPLDLHAPSVSPHLQAIGMGCAFVLSALFIVYFVRCLSTALVVTESALEEAHLLRARDEKLASLGTLAAGAAHELATPLGVILVAAKELHRQLSASDCDLDAARSDAALISAEVSRCRDVLSQMTYDTGAAQGEAFRLITLRRLLHDAAAPLEPDALVVTVASDHSETEPQVRVPVKSALHALRGILRNAVEAASGKQVEVSASSVGGTCFIRVSDRGHGMTPSVLARATEPFFTTKTAGAGMGLGLFLARSTFERLGGGVAIESRVAHGTTVVARLPVGGYTPHAVKMRRATKKSARAARTDGADRADDSAHGGIGR